MNDSTSPTTDIQPVIQADIDAALELVSPHEARRIKARTCDDHMLVQAFARHRLTFTTPTLGDMVLVPFMPPCDARGLHDDAKPDGYRESNNEWCRRNTQTVTWLIDNSAAIRTALSAAPASPIPTATGDMGKARLALEAIKAVTATTKDAVAGLSRIMAITRSAGVDAPYSDLMAKPDVALIVNRPRGEWRHLFERADACTIPPKGWTCSRAPGHDGPCAASLSLPITQRDEQGAKTYADGIADAAKVADQEADDIKQHAHLASDAWQQGREAMARTIATAIRRLSIEQGDQDGNAE